jgi:hypothetical protein
MAKKPKQPQKPKPKQFAAAASKGARKPKVAGSHRAIAQLTKTGTTYNAGKTALAQIPRPQLGSEEGSSLPVRIIDPVPQLVSAYQRTITYSQMMTDAGVDMSVRAIKTPVLGAEFFIEPYSSDPQDVLICDFIWDNLAKGMSAPLLNSLADILHFFEDGFSVLEKVYENREWSPNAKGANTRTYTMLKKLGVRPGPTITQITYDNNGGPTGVIQRAIQSDGSTKEVTIDISKCMIFTFGKVGGDLTGKSILRTAYAHWYYKTHFYKIDAVQKERHGIGIPRGKLGPAATLQDKVALRTMLRNLRTNEESFIIETPNVAVDFVELKGQTVDALESAGHHNMMILMNIMAQFLAQGTGPGGASGSGGRATGATSSDLFMKSLKFVANLIAQNFNMYVIPELVVWNFPTSNFPQVKVRNIGETRDLQMLGAAISNLVAQGGIIMDDPTENWIREVFDMPGKQPGAPGQRAPSQEQFLGADGAGTPTQQTNGTNAPPPVPPLGTNGGGTAAQKGNIKPNAIKTGNLGKPPSSPN